jgi:hypothetical protein
MGVWVGGGDASYKNVLDIKNIILNFIRPN